MVARWVVARRVDGGWTVGACIAGFAVLERHSG